MNVTINLSKLNVPVVKLASVAGRLQKLLADPTVTTVLEFSLSQRQAVDVIALCDELKVPYTTYRDV